MNWTQATRGQLYEIAFNDSGATPAHRLAAYNELQRRKGKARNPNIKYTEKR